MSINRVLRPTLLATAALTLVACQSSGQSSSVGGNPAQPQMEDSVPLDVAAEETSTQEPTLQADDGDTADVPQGASAVATLPQTGACTIQLAGGPPAKPPRGADFGKAAAKNTGKAIGRGIIQNIGARLGGGLGGAVAGGVANNTIRAEQDIKGVWNITDGSANCACTLKVDGLFKMTGKGNDAGSIVPQGCVTPTVAAMKNWALGYSFAGYDAKFELKAADKRTVLATLNRDGIHYFSGTLAEGTPVVMWRDGQNYTKLRQ